MYLPSPKVTSRERRSAWYAYYAGFSRAFVRRSLEALRLNSPQLVLDPWNGSGTTTAAAVEVGCRAFGVDLNPAMVLVAKGRCLSPASESAAIARAEPLRARSGHPCVDDDPLLSWLTEPSAQAVRSLERSLRAAIPHEGGGEPDWSQATAADGLLYTALFRAVRTLVHVPPSSNPAWTKLPVSTLCASGATPQAIDTAFRTSLDATRRQAQLVAREPSVALADSRALPLPDGSADAVLSSPPYCTRLDYAMATRLELAIMGLPQDSAIRALRDRLIGTPTVNGSVPQVRMEWGATCALLLAAIAAHPSRASSGYYLKTHLQYFDGLNHSLLDLDRVLKPGGHCVLVVQNSYYKSIPNDLPAIVSEMAEILGWTISERRDFEVPPTFSRLNPRSRAYLASRRTVESVLHFTK